MHGIIRVGSAVPKLKVSDCIYNRKKILELIKLAEKKGVKALCFPELCTSAYTCADLFFQSKLISECEKSVFFLLKESKNIDMLIAVGAPVVCSGRLFNCAVIINRGTIIGIVPKTYIPNYNEFYEKRWFSPAFELSEKETQYCGQIVPIGNDIIFVSEKDKNFSIGFEICEDLWAPIPPSSFAATSGATVLFNLSASNELAAKNDYRNSLVSAQSASKISAYIYTSAGIGESTQDLVFSGHSVIYENGVKLSETERFSQDSQLIFADIDTELLSNDRRKNTSFFTKGYEQKSFRYVNFSVSESRASGLARPIARKPFVPSDNGKLNERCSDIFNIQLVGLSKRFVHTKSKKFVIGISGGLDSTLALLVTAKASDFIGISRSSIIGVTMPGFGTTDRTYNNALNLMNSLNITTIEISIKNACIQHFKDIDHDISVHDVTYENTQARERTQILMDIANKENGIVVGTGDLSELALGWATYNGDHMSMYGVNSGIPKTLVRVLVKHVADSKYLDNKSNRILADILDTPVSPELLPPSDSGEMIQKTEDIVGPYELHDFFLYYVVRFGFSPSKILFFAEHAFNGVYSREILIKWLRNFYRRFFSQQFKRSCLPDGPKAGTINLSPRGDWRMPSDAEGRIWLEEVNKL